MIKVKFNEGLTIDDIYNAFDSNGMLGDSFNEITNDQIEVINTEDSSMLSPEYQDKIEEYGEERGTMFNGEMERKWFFEITEEGEGEFSYGGFLSFYNDDSVIYEFDGNEDDFGQWRNDIIEYCNELGWNVI